MLNYFKYVRSKLIQDVSAKCNVRFPKHRLGNNLKCVPLFCPTNTHSLEHLMNRQCGEIVVSRKIETWTAKFLHVHLLREVI